ncbi:hypothetical protein M6B38_168780 [Iris pallida]|uniref:Uncharacterized protein n=1 Tax=Iris pallida TaxID=29817 RepID=A0AAX6EVP7_IRIPA|nr:hypothetical protein M6B38_168780 [Iris pallida]
MGRFVVGVHSGMVVANGPRTPAESRRSERWRTALGRGRPRATVTERRENN